jgi:hypothetical protein
LKALIGSRPHPDQAQISGFPAAGIISRLVVS